MKVFRYLRHRGNFQNEQDGSNLVAGVDNGALSHSDSAPILNNNRSTIDLTTTSILDLRRSDEYGMRKKKLKKIKKLKFELN